MLTYNQTSLAKYVRLRIVVIGLGFIFGGGPFAFATLSKLCVTNFGAYGDTVCFFANTTSNSYIVTCTNEMSDADVGKAVEIFGAGRWNFWTNKQDATLHTNIADLVAIIKNVTSATNITLDRPAGNTTNQASALFGTQCSAGFQDCINSASPNCTILIPAGNYLLIPPKELDPNAVFKNGFDVCYAVTISKGGIHLQGAGAAVTTLIGLGAWQKTSNGVITRGTMFGFIGPVTNDSPVLFEQFTMDGGVAQGHTSYAGWPARGDGDGWDCTHHALHENGHAPWNATKTFLNCNFLHWRGEMFISSVGFPYPANNFDYIKNCLFSDGNGSGVNINFSHTITGCCFSNLVLTAEIYQGFMAGPCVFSNNIIASNIDLGFTLLGAQADHIQPNYTIISNNISGTTGLNITEAQNVIILGNHFHDMPRGSAIFTPVLGAQSTNPATNNNILVVGNTFTNVAQAFLCGGYGVCTMQNLVFTNNIMNTGAAMVNGFGFGTNMVIKNNIAINTIGVDSSKLQGQWYFDDLSNQFPFININDFGTGKTNAISYNLGARLNIHAVAVNSAYYLDDSVPWAIPPGAKMILKNGSGRSELLYLSASLKGASIMMTNSYSGTFAWGGNAWTPFDPNALSPPINLRLFGPAHYSH